MIFDIPRKLTLKVTFWQLTVNPKLKNQYVISFEYVDSQAKIFLNLYPPLENSTNRVAIGIKKILGPPELGESTESPKITGPNGPSVSSRPLSEHLK